jgi:hypothetical protein
LLLDEFEPMDLKPDEVKGAPDHSQRGFDSNLHDLQLWINLPKK